MTAVVRRKWAGQAHSAAFHAFWRSFRHLPAAVLLAGAAGLLASIIVALLPVDLIEYFAQNSGIAALLPAAQPPLGTTARLVSALVAAAVTAPVIWAGLFLMIGHRRVAALVSEDAPARVSGAVSTSRPLHATEDAAPVIRRADSHPDAPPRRPLSARRDLGPPLEPRSPVHLTDAPTGAINERRGAGGSAGNEVQVARSVADNVQGAARVAASEFHATGSAAPLPLRAATMPEPIDAPAILPPGAPSTVSVTKPTTEPVLMALVKPPEPAVAPDERLVPAGPAAAPCERALPSDLDQPMAAFDPAALIRSVPDAALQSCALSPDASPDDQGHRRAQPVPPMRSTDGASCRFPDGGASVASDGPAVGRTIRPQRFAADERFETFALDRAHPIARPNAAPIDRDTDAAATIHALLDRLERGVVLREPPGIRPPSIPQTTPLSARPGNTIPPDHPTGSQQSRFTAPVPGLAQTLSMLRHLASGGN